MCCVAVAEFMREDGDAKFAPGLLDGALEIGFVHPVANLSASVRMTTGVTGREQPGPRPGELVFGEFLGQLMREHQRDVVLFIPLPDGAGKFDLLDQFRNQRMGQGNHPVLTTLGTHDNKTQSLQINIFDSQIEWFGDTQPTAVKQS